MGNACVYMLMQEGQRHREGEKEHARARGEERESENLTLSYNAFREERKEANYDPVCSTCVGQRAAQNAPRHGTEQKTMHLWGK